ncbi:MAG: hypothetical protein JNG85_10330 [Spirochaetaceae bacterium]|nr:hypothetical protein [Spirochaetaceae bacterium]
METFGSILIALAVSALVATAAYLLDRYRRRGRGAATRPEDLILEEALVTRPIPADGEGCVAARKRGPDAELPARAREAGRSFPVGAKVRIIDYRDGRYLVEAADEEHLVH